MDVTKKTVIKKGIAEEMEKEKTEIIKLMIEMINGVSPILSDNGDYLLEIRETKFEPNNNTFYSIVTLTHKEQNISFTKEIEVASLPVQSLSDFASFNEYVAKEKKDEHSITFSTLEMLEIQKIKIHTQVKNFMNAK